MKSEGSLQERCYRLAFAARHRRDRRHGGGERRDAVPRSDAYWQRWFAWPQVLFTAQVPLLVVIASVVFFLSLRRQHHYTPFLMALALFALGLVGLGISLFPYVVPRAVTIWDAAAPAASLKFMLVGAVDHGADHPRLHRLCVLGLPRQDRP